MSVVPVVSPTPSGEVPSRTVVYTALGTGALALTVVAGVLGASAQTDQATAVALLRAGTAGVPLAAGLYGCYTRQFAAFSRLLLAIGAVAALAALAESSDPTAYTVGRLSGYGLELLLVVTLLAFPRSAPRGRGDRALVSAMAVAIGAFVLSAVVSGTLPSPSPYTSCRTDCPGSAIHVFTLPPPVVTALVGGAGALLFTVLVIVIVRLQRRILLAPEPLATVLRPVLFVGMVRTALVGWAILGRALDPAAPATYAASELVAWCSPLLGVAFLIGLIQLRFGDERALTDLARRVGDATSPGSIQRAFAEAFGTRGPRLLLAGEPTVHPGPSRVVRELHDGDGAVLGALACDPAVAERPDLLEAAGALGTVALENLRLTRAADAAATEIARSRARMAATAERERRRIERDLHDGAQQRLVALRIELGLAEEEIARGEVQAGIAHLHELGEAVEAALEDLRTLAHGVCPPLLADRGLAEALKAASAGCPVPTRVAADGLARYPSEVESAVYFCILEALQNVAKHAHGAERALVVLRDDGRGRLQFSVRDDGAVVRGERIVTGVGLANMHDRVEAVGGELHVTMANGTGAEVRGSVPVPA